MPNMNILYPNSSSHEDFEDEDDEDIVEDINADNIDPKQL